MPSAGLIITGVLFLFLGLVISGIQFTRNNVIGYRTKRSMASEEAWLCANYTGGRLLMGSGAVNIIVGWLTWSSPHWQMAVIRLLVLGLGLGLTIYLTERKLVNKFGKESNNPGRKQG